MEGMSVQEPLQLETSFKLLAVHSLLFITKPGKSHTSMSSQRSAAHPIGKLTARHFCACLPQTTTPVSLLIWRQVLLGPFTKIFSYSTARGGTKGVHTCRREKLRLMKNEIALKKATVSHVPRPVQSKLFCSPKTTALYTSIITIRNKQQAVGRNTTLQFMLVCFVLL